MAERTNGDGAEALTSVEELETRLLLEGVYQQYGYDFREYAPSSLRRRLRGLMQAERVRTISELQGRVLHDAPTLERFVAGLTVNVSSMFRDPSFFLLFRRHVVP